ncbi:transferase hexapeptide (six repeat-containing protein) [Algoriphagus hitonicola]|uniref:Transferase hexapeptide (Six repeat-containing protein) n=2 Tax=Algoriphagus hitonicola TaxID=435880 RepID=A0A1I2TFZ9_9BACT|nr:transferase hexapeptide (six repeat-containing protein) [Algoriphagus hitonicola]
MFHRVWSQIYRLLYLPSHIIIEGDPIDIIIGRNCYFEKGVRISNKSGGKIEIGENNVFLTGVILATYGGAINIGNNCSFNPYCVIYGHGGLWIGNYVRIATHTIIIPANHIFESRDLPITKQGLTKKGIRIGDDVWIGANVTILDNVIVGKGCVIGAGAVVNKNTSDFGVYGGVPSKQIGKR